MKSNVEVSSSFSNGAEYIPGSRLCILSLWPCY